jgi:CO dehydrogenase maturation factor
MDELSSQYQYVIIDNEAGMEHLSRRTTNNVDLLCIIAEQTSIGVLTTRRIFDLAKQLPIVVRQIGVIWNKIADSGQRLADSEKKLNAKRHTLNAIETFGHIPYDKAVSDASMQGKTIFDVEANSPAFLAVWKILEQKLT